jgi:hypothetical protein
MKISNSRNVDGVPWVSVWEAYSQTCAPSTADPEKDAAAPLVLKIFDEFDCAIVQTDSARIVAIIANFILRSPFRL